MPRSPSILSDNLRRRAYARGLDMLNAHYMDLVLKGRDEGEGNGMIWLHRRDEYPY